jgi:glycosyltransferase involved in cell wall biosynthesis
MFHKDAAGLKNNTDLPAPLYSVCVTCRNSARTIERSLTSILSQLDDRFEVVVVDGGSTDGTVEALERLRCRYEKLSVICYPSSRGLGRDVAYRRSKGRYLIQGGDADVIFQPTLRSVLDYYHKNEKTFGRYALFIPEAFLICTRDIMDDIGGWPDLQNTEDVYIGGRLLRVCVVERNTSLYSVVVKDHLKSSSRGRLSPSNLTFRYCLWRDFHRFLPFRNALEVLRISLREEIWLPLRFGIATMFLLGVIGQYSKVRYKQRGQDLQCQMKFFKQFYASDFKLVERFTPTLMIT